MLRTKSGIGKGGRAHRATPDSFVLYTKGVGRKGMGLPASLREVFLRFTKRGMRRG